MFAEQLAFAQIWNVYLFPRKRFFYRPLVDETLDFLGGCHDYFDASIRISRDPT